MVYFSTTTDSVDNFERAAMGLLNDHPITLVRNLVDPSKTPSITTTKEVVEHYTDLMSSTHSAYRGTRFGDGLVFHQSGRMTGFIDVRAVQSSDLDKKTAKFVDSSVDLTVLSSVVSMYLSHPEHFKSCLVKKTLDISELLSSEARSNSLRHSADLIGQKAHRADAYYLDAGAVARNLSRFVSLAPSNKLFELPLFSVNLGLVFANVFLAFVVLPAVLVSRFQRFERQPLRNETGRVNFDDILRTLS